MHFFTSITTNYLPKARVLARSIKHHCKDSYFSLVVSDRLPDDFNIEHEPFDEIVYVEDLNIPVNNLNMWIFMHTVVEICTAVKGQAIYNFLHRGLYDKVIYLDPDIVVFDDLSQLENLLSQHSVILTPHLTEPEKTIQAIADNEQCALMHGVYNLGFIAVRNSAAGLEFAGWWRDRLVEFCYDDIPHGIFTDQRWVDLAPALFEDIFILRDASYNVSTWNLTHRNVTKSKDNIYYVNGKPLQFYHFSGFDSGAQESMLNKYGEGNEALLELRENYIKAQDEAGQQQLGKRESIYAYFDNGEKITNEQRVLLRTRKDLLDFFSKTNPFIVTKDYICYHNWYFQEHANKPDEKDARIQQLENEVKMLRKYLAPLIKIKHMFKR